MNNKNNVDELANISDAQLSKRLKEEFDFACGPITSTTRNLYLKKLKSFIENSNSFSLSKSSTPKNRRKTISNVSQIKNESPKAIKKLITSKESPKIKPKTKEKDIKFLNDSESDDCSFLQKPANGATAYSRGNYLLRKTYKKLLSTNPIPKSSTSFKDENTVSSSDESVKQSGGICYVTKATSDQLEKFKNSPAFNLSKPNLLANYSDSENEDLINKKNLDKESKFFTESITKRLLRHRPKPTQIEAKKEYPKFFKLKSLVTQATNKDQESYTTQSNWISITILIAISLFFAFIFSFYFYSRFFSVASREEAEIMAMEKEFDISMNDLELPDCSNFDSEQSSGGFCTYRDPKPLLYLIREMKNIVNRRMLNYYCSDNKNLEDPYKYKISFLRDQIQRSIGKKLVKMVKYETENRPNDNDLFLTLFADALSLLEQNSKWNMKPIGENGIYHEIEIDSKYPKNLHFTCQFKLLMVQTFWHFIILISLFLIGFILYLYYNHRKDKVLKEKELLYDLVDKSIELLQSPDEPQSLPILHIRDMLLNPIERRTPYYQKVWDQVVKFIETNESRIKVSLENIDGEDYKTWKWVATAPSLQADSTLSKNEQLEWQGNLFGNETLSKPTNSDSSTKNISTSTPIKSSTNITSTTQLKDFVALTRFLKVRNLVDNCSKTNENWKTIIKNEIIKKCCNQSSDGKTHGILHIHVDDQNAIGGLVYIKCDSIETASNAFKALHGWWYQKKLVSVKFLKEERYLLRFPNSVNYVDLLKIDEF